MRSFLLAALALLLFVSYREYTFKAPVGTAKTVVRTLTSVESDCTTRQVYTAYWAIAADGTSTRISRGRYAQLDSGAVLTSCAWER